METGRFTMPGESGYEELTLELAKRWGADVIRDSDGTQLSPELMGTGYDIYSTICVIRDHNEWIKVHPDTRQQTFLCTQPSIANSGTLEIDIMQGFFAQQFEIDASAGALAHWQVYDRTTDQLLPEDSWHYCSESCTVVINATPWHSYTVSFVAWRVWEEISMYNHTTNDWQTEPLMQLNPYHPEAMEYLLDWLEQWCLEHPNTDVVRFTSLFYNFVWIWGSDERKRHLFTDWASYDFTISITALEDFEKQYGYRLTAEDFVRQGKYNATHCLPDQKKLDWMEFIGDFVRKASRRLIDIVHKHGKKAYVFYDDSWVGLEPYNGKFEEFGFDGIIKCVFSGFEARLCAGVPVETHELRFHPYLFPVGLGGAPTFSPGGNPTQDAIEYWLRVRRALLRQKVERTGLGGYLHLVQDYPDFVDAMENIMAEFRAIYTLHETGNPYCAKPTIGILHAWGKLRTWTLSGHFHENESQILMHLLESLSGLPFDVQFLSFEDIKNGVPDDIDVILNAGTAGSAWSGGRYWKDSNIVEILTEWVNQGGVFLGAGEPSAVEGYNTYFRMAHVLGVDLDTNDLICHGKWQFAVQPDEALLPEGCDIANNERAYLYSGDALVLNAEETTPTVVINQFGEGCGVYLSSFAVSDANTRMLQNLLLHAAGGAKDGITDNSMVECAVFPDAQKIAFINNGGEKQKATCTWHGTDYRISLEPYKMEILTVE